MHRHDPYTQTSAAMTAHIRTNGHVDTYNRDRGRERDAHAQAREGGDSTVRRTNEIGLDPINVCHGRCNQVNCIISARIHYFGHIQERQESVVNTTVWWRVDNIHRRARR